MLQFSILYNRQIWSQWVSFDITCLSPFSSPWRARRLLRRLLRVSHPAIISSSGCWLNSLWNTVNVEREAQRLWFQRKKGGEGRSWWEEVGEISVGSRLSTGADLFQSLCAVGNIYVTHTQKVLHSFGLDAVNKNIIITCILYVHVV